MNMPVQENETQQWFVRDSMLASYVSGGNEYNLEANENMLRWFNFNLQTPAETEAEAKEKEVAIRHQVQLGIIRVAPQPQQYVQQPAQQQPQMQLQKNGNVQPPQPVLTQDVAQEMQLRITPGVVTMLNGKEVDMDALPQQQTSQPQIQNVQQLIQKPKPSDMVGEFINSAKTEKEKYKFSLNGKKIGKKDPCPCGSGQLFFRCHGI